MKRQIVELFLPLALALAACSPSGGAGAPQIDSFSATPASISAGQKTTLAWTVKGADSVSLDNGLGVQAGSSVDVTPAATTTYTLTAVAGSTSSTATVTVAVTTATAKPVITSFTASPNDVVSGGTTTLSWTVTGATSLTLTAGSAAPIDVTGTSSKTAQVDAPTSFTLTATNAGGSVTATQSVVTHTAYLHLQYTDPTSITARILLVHNIAASTPNRMVLDVKVGAVPVTAFGFAINIPFDPASIGLVALDPNLSPVGLIASSNGINMGSGPATGAALLAGSSSAIPNVLTVGVARHKASVADGDGTWAPGSTLFSIAIQLTSTATAANAGTNVFLASAVTADPRYKAAALARSGAVAVAKADVAIGDFIISN